MATIQGLHPLDLSRFIQITVHDVKYLVSEQALHQVFRSYGAMTVRLSTSMTAVVSFPTMSQAARARREMQGRCIYDNCCWMHIQFASDEEKPVIASLVELRADLERRLAKFAPTEESNAASTSSLSTTSPTAPVPQPGTPEELVLELHAAPELSMPVPAKCSTECQARVSQQMKPSPSLVVSAGQVVGDGGPHADAVFASAMPTSCSAEGIAHYTDSGHAEIVLPASGSTQLHAATSNRCKDVGTDMSAEVLTQVGGLSLFQELELGYVDEMLTDSHVTDLLWYSGTSLTHVGRVSLFLEPCVESTGVVFSEPHQMEGEDDVFTIVGGVSLFQELCVDVSNVMAKMLPEEVWEDGISDQVLTQVGSLSLFVEIDMEIHQELEDNMNKVTCLGHTTSGVNQVCLVLTSEKGKLQLSRDEISRCNLWFCIGGKSAAQFSCHQLSNLRFLLYHGNSSGILILLWDPGITEGFMGVPYSLGTTIGVCPSAYFCCLELSVKPKVEINGVTILCVELHVYSTCAWLSFPWKPDLHTWLWCCCRRHDRQVHNSIYGCDLFEQSYTVNSWPVEAWTTALQYIQYGAKVVNQRVEEMLLYSWINFNIRSVHYFCSIFAQSIICTLGRLWDLGISRAETNAFHPDIFATRGVCLVLNRMPSWEVRSDFSQQSVFETLPPWSCNGFYPWERNALGYGNESNNKHLDVSNGYMLLLRNGVGSYMHCRAGKLMTFLGDAMTSMDELPDMPCLVEGAITATAFESQLQYKQWGVRWILLAEVINLCMLFVVFTWRQLLVFQSMRQCMDWVSLAISANKLQCMTWDPGVHSSACAISLEITAAGARDAGDSDSFLAKITILQKLELQFVAV